MIVYLNGINYFRQPFAQMAELVDALVSNTSGVKPVPVRARLWAQSPQNLRAFLLYCDTYGKTKTIRQRLYENGIGVGKTLLLQTQTSWGANCKKQNDYFGWV